MIELRWIECSRSDKEPPQATHPGWPECGPTYFKLQYREGYFSPETGPQWSGVWKDVPIEFSPEHDDIRREDS